MSQVCPDWPKAIGLDDRGDWVFSIVEVESSVEVDSEEQYQAERWGLCSLNGKANTS